MYSHTCSSVITRGLDNTREKWEAHWSSALSDDDLHWLSETANCTSIRLPIGYFTLGPGFCSNTPFAMQPAQVYVNAWAAVKRLVARCFEHGIGVLLDMHAAPGGANSETHSGTSSGKAELWGNKFNLDLLIKCLCFVAQEVVRGDMKGVIGIQLVNEAQWDPPGMYKFYDDVLMKIAAIDPTLPVYISDGWDLGRALKYAQSKNSVKGDVSNPVIVDTHKYYTFAERHTSCSPQELIGEVAMELSQLDGSRGNVFNNKGDHRADTLEDAD
jgi:aryl-phospho-beta-D-glucosidase BglC (GH1 family)